MANFDTPGVFITPEDKSSHFFYFHFILHLFQLPMHVKPFTYAFSLSTSISTSVLGYNTHMNTAVKEATVRWRVTSELSPRQPIEFAPFVMIWIQRNRSKDVSGPQSASLFFVHPWV